MISKYYQFDVKKFFSEYDNNKTRLRDLQIDLAQIPSASGGMDYSVPRVTSNKISDSVFVKVSQRELVQEKIDALESYFRLHALIMARLDDEETVLTELYRNSNGYAIDDVCNRLCYSKTTIYQHLEMLTRKIREIVDFEMGK